MLKRLTMDLERTKSASLQEEEVLQMGKMYSSSPLSYQRYLNNDNLNFSAENGRVKCEIYTALVAPGKLLELTNIEEFRLKNIV